MYNLNLKGSPYEMGTKLGKIFRKNKIEFLKKGQKLPTHHKESAEYLIYKYHRKSDPETEHIYVPIKLNKFQKKHGKDSTKLLEKIFPRSK